MHTLDPLVTCVTEGGYGCMRRQSWRGCSASLILALPGGTSHFVFVSALFLREKLFPSRTRTHSVPCDATSDAERRRHRPPRPHTRCSYMCIPHLTERRPVQPARHRRTQLRGPAARLPPGRSKSAYPDHDVQASQELLMENEFRAKIAYLAHTLAREATLASVGDAGRQR
jgi:hypothetical protein